MFPGLCQGEPGQWERCSQWAAEDSRMGLSPIPCVPWCCGTLLWTAWGIPSGVYSSLCLALLPVPACGWCRQLCIPAPLQHGCSSRSTKSRCCSILLSLLPTPSISQLAANSLPQLLGLWQGWAAQSQHLLLGFFAPDGVAEAISPAQ